MVKVQARTVGLFIAGIFVAGYLLGFGKEIGYTQNKLSRQPAFQGDIMAGSGGAFYTIKGIGKYYYTINGLRYSLENGKLVKMPGER